MNPLARILKKVRILFGRERFRVELDEEMAFHRLQAEREFVAAGMTAEEARYAAMRRFGNETRMKERSHEAVGFSLETVAQDLKYALRQLALNPGFTAVITLTLALSIGANSAIFSVIEGVLLKPLPYPRAERIVRVFLSSRDFPKFALNPFDFRDLREHLQSFDSFAAYTHGDVQLSGGGEPMQVSAFGITSGYFRVLGIKPELGREFDAKAELPGNGQQIILSDRLWRTRLGAAPDIVGRTITVNMLPFTVVGVMPPGTEHPGNVYNPLPYGDSVDAWWAFTFVGDPADRGSHYMEGIGRLKSGVTADQAQGEINAVIGRLDPGLQAGGDWKFIVIPLYREIVGAQQRMLLVLLGAVGMVLLIACANAANLLLARAAARQREVAVRLALGAPRRRLMRQMLTESLLISVLGGGLGLVLAVGGVMALVSLLPAGFPRASEIHVNATVFGFTLLISILTGILFGLAPAWQASRTDPKQGLHEGGRTATGSRRQRGLRNALVVSEVGLACVLLIGAGLMLRSFLNQVNENAGFRQDHVLTASLSLPMGAYKPDATRRFYSRLMAEIQAIPGVQSAGAGSDFPWTGYDDNTSFDIEGKKPAPHEGFHARYHVATPEYFNALGIPLVQGRSLKDSDTETSPNVVIINQAMAKRYWPNEDPLGKRITFEDNPKEKDWLTVVGVVGDVKDKPDSPAAEAAFWWPHLQAPHLKMSVVIRANGDPALLADAFRDRVKQLDPTLAVANVRQMDKIADASIATPRLAFVLVGLFAGLAIVLAAIGTYGVIAYSVSQRIPEFSLRMALGAPRGDVLRLVMGQAARLAVAGSVAGVCVALALARVLRSLIYNVSPADPVTYVAVGAGVIAIAMLACYLPARRAMQASPMAALRAE